MTGMGKEGKREERDKESEGRVEIRGQRRGWSDIRVMSRLKVKVESLTSEVISQTVFVCLYQ